jgi:hypothetical protein
MCGVIIDEMNKYRKSESEWIEWQKSLPEDSTDLYGTVFITGMLGVCDELTDYFWEAMAVINKNSNITFGMAYLWFCDKTKTIPNKNGLEDFIEMAGK